MFTVIGTFFQMLFKLTPAAPVLENGKYKTPAKDNTHPTQWLFTPADDGDVLKSGKVESSKCPLEIVESGELSYRKFCPAGLGETPWSKSLTVKVV
jgi:hypothetical protein